MRISSLSLFAALGVAAAAGLAACSSGISPAAPPTTATQAIAGSIRSDAAGASSNAQKSGTDALVYISDFTCKPGCVDVFKRGKFDKPIATITNGLTNPKGAAVDASGNLYVDDAGSEKVQVYAPGSYSQPSRTYTAGIYDPQGLVVAPNGTLYVVSACCESEPSQPAQVTVYPPNSINPSEYLDLPAEYTPHFVAVDTKGNLFVSGIKGGSCTTCGSVFEFKAGNGPAVDLNLQNLGSAEGVAVDPKGNIVVADFYDHVIDVYPAGGGAFSRQISIDDTPYGLSFSKDASHLYVSGVINNDVVDVDYKTGKIVATITGFGHVEDPAASPPRP